MSLGAAGTSARATERCVRLILTAASFSIAEANLKMGYFAFSISRNASACRAASRSRPDA
jgi:hypothetical protein